MNDLTPSKLIDIPGGVARGNPLLVAVYGLYPELYRDGFKQLLSSRIDFGAELGKPFVFLKEFCDTSGITLSPLDEISETADVDALLVFDLPVRVSRHYSELIGRENVAKILVLQECPIIHPPNWDYKNHEAFDLVFTWNKELASRKNYQHLPWTSPWACTNQLDKVDSEPRDYLLINISSNKTSPRPGELYSERIRAVNFFSKALDSRFALYGHGWDSKEFPAYKGVSQNKLATLTRSEFSICFENFSGINGYITEKIYDCIISGAIPIYLGAPDIADNIDSKAFVDARKFRSYPEILDFILNLSRAEIVSIREAGASFLSKHQSFPFSIDYLIASITSSIVRLCQQKKRQQPKITICIPSFNAGQFLEQSVQSALEALRGIDGNLFILDNASTDDTYERIEPYLEDCRVYYFKNRINIGSGYNHELCVLLGQGELLKILHADDILKPDHITNAILAFDANPDVNLYYSRIEKIDSFGRPMGIVAHVGQPKESGISDRNEALELLQHDCFVTLSASVMRRDLVARIGIGDHQFEGAGDWDFWIRLAGQGGRFFFSTKAEVQYRVHSEQDSVRFYSTSSHIDDHLRILRKHLPAVSPTISDQALLNTLGLAFKKISSRKEFAPSRLPELSGVFQNTASSSLTKTVLEAFNIDDKFQIDSVVIDLDFSGGLGAQLLSLGIYFVLLAAGFKVKPDLSYFTTAAKDYSHRGPNLPSHWHWALGPYGYLIHLVESFGCKTELSSCSTVRLRDGVLKSRLSSIASKLFLNDRLVPDVALKSDLVTIEQVKKATSPSGYVALHLRRGDYRAVASHMVADQTSVDCASSLGNIAGSIVVCSDEVVPKDVCAQLSSRFRNVFAFDSKALSQYGAIHIFRNSKALVMSNSQLSYVGACLTRGIAFSPRKWFGDGQQSLNDIVTNRSDFLLFKK